MDAADWSRRDVVIVGARVAGSATAMLLARLGYDVAVVDQATLPSDTLSTHSIARSGVVQLQRWGLLDEILDSGTPAVRQITFHSSGESVTRPIKDKVGVDFLIAPRRYVLDTILAAAAEQAGATLRLGVTVTGVRRDGRDRVVGVYGRDHAGRSLEIGARYVIGADGLRSLVARSVDAAVNEFRGANGATQYAYYAGIPWTGIEFFLAERSLAGVFPTHDGEACIWICNPAAREADSPPYGVAYRGLRTAAGALGASARRTAAPRPPRVAGSGHAAPTQPAASGLWSGLGSGGGLGIPP
jgi:2-polyprenyl-6-methoxyphenol hydroxylase-like FAD-dependent oxidoreductase